MQQALEKGHDAKYKVVGKDMKLSFTTSGKVIPSMKLNLLQFKWHRTGSSMSCRNVSVGSQLRGVISRRDGSWLQLRGKWEGTAGLCPQMKGFLAEWSSWSINTLQRPALLPAWVCSVLKREQLTPPLFTDKAVVERALGSQKNLSLRHQRQKAIPEEPRIKKPRRQKLASRTETRLQLHQAAHSDQGWIS